MAVKKILCKKVRNSLSKIRALISLLCVCVWMPEVIMAHENRSSSNEGFCHIDLGKDLSYHCHVGKVSIEKISSVDFSTTKEENFVFISVEYISYADYYRIQAEWVEEQGLSKEDSKEFLEKQVPEGGVIIVKLTTKKQQKAPMESLDEVVVLQNKNKLLALETKILSENIRYKVDGVKYYMNTVALGLFEDYLKNGSVDVFFKTKAGQVAVFRITQ